MADFSRKSPGKHSADDSAFRLGRPRLAAPATKRLLVVLAAAIAGIGILLPLRSAHATGSFISATSGSWGSPSTWVGNSGFPTCADDVTITNGITVTLDTTRCSNNLTIQNGGVLDMNGQLFYLSNSGSTFSNNGTLAGSAGFATFNFYGNGTPGAITQTLSGSGTYTSGIQLRFANSVAVSVAPSTSLIFAAAANTSNMQIDNGSVLTLSNPLTLTAPTGPSFVQVLNNGAVAGSGGLKTHGNVYLLGNGGGWSAPVEILSDVAQGYGTFTGPFKIDSGATFVLASTMNLYDNLTVPGGAKLDLNGQATLFRGGGKTFSNNGTLANSNGSFGYFEFYGDGTPGDVVQSFSGSGIYTSSLRLLFANSVAVNTVPATSLTFSTAASLDNFHIDSGSTLTLTNPLTVSVPAGPNFVQLYNNGALAGSGGLKTHGNVYLLGNGGGWTAPVEILSDVAQGYGTFTGPFKIDSGATFVLASTLNLYDNLTVPSGATLDLNGQATLFQGSGKTFDNNGTLANSGSFGYFKFYGNGTPGSIVQSLSGSGAYTSGLQLLFANSVAVNVAPATSLIFANAANASNMQIDNGSVLTLSNPLTLTAPTGPSFVQVLNNGAVAGSGGLKTHGNVYLLGNSGGWSAPVEILSDVAQGYGTFTGPFKIDPGATFVLASTLNLYDNLTVPGGATLDLHGQATRFQGSGKTFNNNGTLANSTGSFGYFVFYGNGTPGSIVQSFSGSGIYTSGLQLLFANSVAVNTVPATSLTFSAAASLDNFHIDSGSTLTLTNPLTVSVPAGPNFVQLYNNGALAGSGGLKTHGNVYLLANSGGWTAPVEILSDVAQGYGSFAGPFKIDTGASFAAANTIHFYDNLTVPSGATFDLNAQSAFFHGNGKTFSNNGTLANSNSSFGYFEFYGDGTPGSIVQSFSGSGTYTSSLRLQLSNSVGVAVAPATSLTFSTAASLDNFHIDSGSTLTLTNPLTLSVPPGPNFVQLYNNGAIAGSGGLKTHGNVYLLGNSGAWSAPVEILSDVAQGYGTFTGPFKIDPGATFQIVTSSLTLYDNLTIPGGATLDFNGQALFFRGNGTTFANNGIVTNSGASTILYFYGNGTPGAVVQHFAPSGAGSFTANLLEEVANCDTVVLDGDAQLGAVQIDSCSVLNITNHTLKLSAPGTALTVNGTIIMPGSNIELDGTALQHVQTSLGGAFISSLTINNPAGVDIPNPSANPLTIPAILTLTNGLFTLNNNLTIGNGATIARAAGSLDSAPAFAGTVNIRYFGATALAAGFELPPSKTINNLTDGDTSPVTLGISLTVNSNAVVAAGATLSGGVTTTLNFNGASFANDGLVSVPSVPFGGGAQALAGTGSFSPDSTLAILNGSTTTLNSDHQLGSLNVNSGGTFDITNRTLKLSGAGTPLTVSGTLTLPGSTVEYDGSSAQTLPATVLTYNNLTLNNPAGVTGISGLTVQGLLRVKSGTFTSSTTYNNVQIDGGATLAGTNGTTINVGGGWTNNGTFSANGSTVNFDGAAPQTIGGTAATAFDGLTINNGAGVTLGSNASVNLTLTLSTDLTTTGSYTLGLGANELATGSGDVIGRVSRGGFTQGTRYSFGNPDVQVAFGAGDIPSSLSVELARSAPAGLALAVGRTYTLTAASGSVFSATVRLRYRDSEAGSLDENRLGLWRSPGSNWLLVGESARDTGANWVEQAGVAAFGRFGLSDLFLQLFLPLIKR